MGERHRDKDRSRAIDEDRSTGEELEDHFCCEGKQEQSRDSHALPSIGCASGTQLRHREKNKDRGVDPRESSVVTHLRQQRPYRDGNGHCRR